MFSTPPLMPAPSVLMSPALRFLRAPGATAGFLALLPVERPVSSAALLVPVVTLLQLRALIRHTTPCTTPLGRVLVAVPIAPSDTTRHAAPDKPRRQGVTMGLNLLRLGLKGAPAL